MILWPRVIQYSFLFGWFLTANVLAFSAQQLPAILHWGFGVDKIVQLWRNKRSPTLESGLLDLHTNGEQLLQCCLYCLQQQSLLNYRRYTSSNWHRARRGRPGKLDIISIVTEIMIKISNYDRWDPLAALLIGWRSLAHLTTADLSRAEERFARIDFVEICLPRLPLKRVRAEPSSHRLDPSPLLCISTVLKRIYQQPATPTTYKPSSTIAASALTTFSSRVLLKHTAFILLLLYFSNLFYCCRATLVSYLIPYHLK